MEVHILSAYFFVPLLVIHVRLILVVLWTVNRSSSRPRCSVSGMWPHRTYELPTRWRND